MKDLNESTDQLNLALERAEEALVDLNLGVRAFILLNDKDGAELGFGKHKNRWRLLYRYTDHEEPLVTAGRELRVSAALKLQDLLIALHVEARNQMEVVQQAIAEVERFLQNLESEIGPT